MLLLPNGRSGFTTRCLRGNYVCLTWKMLRWRFYADCCIDGFMHKRGQVNCLGRRLMICWSECGLVNRLGKASVMKGLRLSENGCFLLNQRLPVVPSEPDHKHGRLIDLLNGNIQLDPLVTHFTCPILILKRNAAL